MALFLKKFGFQFHRPVFTSGLLIMVMDKKDPHSEDSFRAFEFLFSIFQR